MNDLSYRDAGHPANWAGYRRHSRARSTGVLVVLVDGIEQGLTSVEDVAARAEGRWFLICDSHGSLLSDEHQPTLRTWMAVPEDWCADCRAIVDARRARIPR